MLPRFNFDAALTAIIMAKEKGEHDKDGQLVVEKKEEYFRYVARLMNGFAKSSQAEKAEYLKRMRTFLTGIREVGEKLVKVAGSKLEGVMGYTSYG